MRWISILDIPTSDYQCLLFSAFMTFLMNRLPEFGEPGNYTGASLQFAIESCMGGVHPQAQKGDYAM
jgi:hypothetical protein